MKTKYLLLAVLPWVPLSGAMGQTALPPPHFHHLALNSTDPGAAIAFYLKEFPSTARTSWEGMPALTSPTHVMIVFQKVAAPPPADPFATAYWHFGWTAADSRKSLERFRAQNLLVPFYTDDQGHYVGISSDTWPYPPGVPGRTRAQIAEAIAQKIFNPAGSPATAISPVPTARLSNSPATRPSVSIMFICGRMIRSAPSSGMSAIWKPRRAADPAPPAPVAGENCRMPRDADPSWPSLDRKGTYRSPTGGVSFDDVAMNWYMNQTDKPLAPTIGRLMDHVSLSVSDLDAWIAKLKGEGVVFLKGPYHVGATRAVMIEGPSHEAIELVDGG